MLLQVTGLQGADVSGGSLARRVCELVRVIEAGKVTDRGHDRDGRDRVDRRVWSSSCRSSACTAACSWAGRSWRDSQWRPVVPNRSDTGGVGAKLRVKIAWTWLLIPVRCRTMGP